MTDVITTAILAKAGRTGISERRCNGIRRKSGMTMAREKEKSRVSRGNLEGSYTVDKERRRNAGIISTNNNNKEEHTTSYSLILSLYV